ncbi:MAG: hypothetical protein K1X94_16995 [Sandaracinaceae bacterium]|nr:hypothetical protein [Sandaracinaceae bacterium]
MRALGIAILRGLLKGLVIGLTLGLVLTYALRWAVPVGSLLGYLAAMAACGTTGVAGGKAPWKEGAWLVAGLKALAGVGVGALLYWVLDAHLDATLPSGLVALLALPDGGAELSWVSYPPLALAAITASFGLLVELDHLGGDDDTEPATKPATKSKSSAAPSPTREDKRRASPALARTEIENAETVPDSVPPPSRTRRDRPADKR